MLIKPEYSMSNDTLGGIWLALIVILVFAQACAFGVAGSKLLEPLDRAGEGFTIGFFLGPVGLVIAWAIRDNGLREQDRRERRTSAAGAPSSVPTPAPRRPSEPRRFK